MFSEARSWAGRDVGAAGFGIQEREGAEAGRTLAQRRYVAFRRYFNRAPLFLALLRGA